MAKYILIDNIIYILEATLLYFSNNIQTNLEKEFVYVRKCHLNLHTLIDKIRRLCPFWILCKSLLNFSSVTYLIKFKRKWRRVFALTVGVMSRASFLYKLLVAFSEALKMRQNTNFLICTLSLHMFAKWREYR